MRLCLLSLLPLLTRCLQMAMNGPSGGPRQCLIVGLNAAYQKIITLPSLVPSSVNRASSALEAVGGKGQNVVLASSCLGQRPMLAQFLGGAEGDTVSRMLHNINPNSGKFTISTKAKTRTCTTLIDERSSEATEIIEPSGAISEVESLELLTKLRDAFAQEKVGVVTIMGSAPPGISEHYYSDIVSACGGAGTKVVIDSLYGVFQVVDVCVAKGFDLCVKINARELLKLVGYRPPTGVSEKETERAVDDASILAATTLLRDRLGGALIKSDIFVCLTDGPFSAYLLPIASREGGGVGASYSKYSLPPLPRGLVNPIGAGDSVAAGLTAAWCGACQVAAGAGPGLPRSVEEAFRFGLACGMASCLTTVNAALDEGDARALVEKIEVKRVSL